MTGYWNAYIVGSINVGNHGVDLNTIVCRARGFIFTRFGDEFVAIDPDSGNRYNLNGASDRIWELIEAPSSIGSICEQLVADFEVPHDVCVSDVMAFIAEMRGLGLIEIVTSAGDR